MRVYRYATTSSNTYAIENGFGCNACKGYVSFRLYCGITKRTSGYDPRDRGWFSRANYRGAKRTSSFHACQGYISFGSYIYGADRPYSAYVVWIDSNPAGDANTNAVDNNLGYDTCNIKIGCTSDADRTNKTRTGNSRDVYAYANTTTTRW